MSVNHLLPNLFIIGVQKAGTTSLHNWLMQHPDIYSNELIKDQDFFSHPERSKDPAGFLNDFISGYNNEKIILQTHVNYILYEKALKRIKEVCDNEPKFILVLRDPVDRAVSAYKYFVKVLREKRSPEKALIYKPTVIDKYSMDNNDFTYIEHGFYFQQLQVYEKYFSLNDLFVINLSDLANDKERTVKEAFNFLNLDSDFIPSFKTLNVTGAIKSNEIQRFLYTQNKIKQYLIKILNPVMGPKIRKKMKAKLTEMNTSRKKGIENIEINPKIEEYLYKAFYEDTKNLLTRYNMEFVKEWMKY